jgi:hypothetical protein
MIAIDFPNDLQFVIRSLGADRNIQFFFHYLAVGGLRINSGSLRVYPIAVFGSFLHPV